jgi:hypothetical protein
MLCIAKRLFWNPPNGNSSHPSLPSTFHLLSPLRSLLRPDKRRFDLTFGECRDVVIVGCDILSAQKLAIVKN